ncbi:MAG TPA: hypothetical protein VF188_17590 [Longimicrobiales bacterium]
MRLLALAAAGAAQLPAPTAAAAQQLDVWLNASAAHALPPAGAISAEATTFGLLGTRLILDRPGLGSLDLALDGGLGPDADAGAWLAGSVAAGAVRRLGPLGAGLRIEAFGLRYRRPFAYTAYGASLRPRLSASLGAFTFTLHGEATRGRWTRPNLDRPNRFDGPLEVTGGALSAGRRLGAAWLEVTGETYRAGGPIAGTFRGADALVAFPLGDAAITLDTRLWDAPGAAGLEVGYEGTLRVPVAPRLAGNLSIGRSVTDPLYGTPGSFAASVGLSWHAASTEVFRSPPVVEVVGPAEEGGRRVRFQLPAGEARRVAIAGDFTGWQPRPMGRTGDVWTLEVVLAAGVYHFGFLLDGERWYVPDDAPGIVDDGWGRRNGSIVVQGG